MDVLFMGAMSTFLAIPGAMIPGVLNGLVASLGSATTGTFLDLLLFGFAEEDLSTHGQIQTNRSRLEEAMDRQTLRGH